MVEGNYTRCTIVVIIIIIIIIGERTGWNTLCCTTGAYSVHYRESWYRQTASYWWQDSGVQVVEPRRTEEDRKLIMRDLDLKWTQTFLNRIGRSIYNHREAFKNTVSGASPKYSSLSPKLLVQLLYGPTERTNRSDRLDTLRFRDSSIRSSTTTILLNLIFLFLILPVELRYTTARGRYDDRRNSNFNWIAIIFIPQTTSNNAITNSCPRHNST